MKNYYFLSILLLGILSFLVVDSHAQYAPKKQQEQPNFQQVNNQFSTQSLRFTENKGQVADLNGKLRPDILFTAQNDGVKLFLTANGIHYQFRREFTKQEQSNEKPGRPEIEAVDSTQFYRLDLRLKGANSHPEIIKEGAGKDVENFFHAHCPDGITGVKNYNRITYKEVYPNIDWVVYVKEGMLEYDFVVKPGGNIEDIKLQYNGAENLELDKLGALHIKTPLGKVTEQKPFSFQQEGKEVASSFVLAGNVLGFEVPGYDENKALTIDPSIVWATYYGGGANEEGNAVAVDGSGNVYLAGTTSSASGIASGGFQNLIGGGSDAFLVKFNSEGNRIWATYYGGSSNESGYSCAIDANGNVYVAGITESASGIAYNGFQNEPGGDVDGSLVKLNSSGSILWATYYGGENMDIANSCEVDLSGNIYLSGFTSSPTNIASEGFKNAFNESGDEEAFLVKFSSTGDRIWGTYYGGEWTDEGHSCAVDASGNIYLAGYTSSPEEIASGGFDNTINTKSGYFDGFLVKFNSDGGRVWGTYYGGEGDDYGFSCAVDGSDGVYLSGIAESSDMASNGFQNVYAGRQDAFLAKFNNNGLRLWATYYGGSEVEDSRSCITDAQGNVFLIGETQSSTGIAMEGFQNTIGGGHDGFVVKFNATGSRLWASYFGGAGNEKNSDINLASGSIYISGNTTSLTAIANGGFQNSIGGGIDAFLVKISDPLPVLDSDDDGVPDADDCAPNDAAKFHSGSLYKDSDNDGYDAGTEIVCYGASLPNGYKLTTLGADCLDSNPDIYPGATEICDGIDNNCDGQTDEGVLITWYKDTDNDGYSNGVTLVQCRQPDGYKPAGSLLATTGDCIDDNPAIHPGATELCDGKDNDCDAQTDEGCPVGTSWYLDYDNDGYGNPAKKVQATTRPRGYVAKPGDCRDWDALSFPTADEQGDGIDNDCDGLVDEGLPCQKTWYYDGDGDGFGADAYTRLSCKQHNNYVLLAGDCKNWDASVYPGHGCPPLTAITGTDANTKMPKAMVETSPEMVVFPNPATTEITVTLNGFEAGKKLELKLVQADGKVVLGQSLTPFIHSQQVRINVSRLSAGYYLLQVKQGELQQTKKVIIVQ